MNESLPEIHQAYQRMSGLSSFADRWLELTLKCNGWSIPPSESSPWSQAVLRGPINTSFPLLFVANSFDPATPLTGALATARMFEKAALIEQKSEGHCSYAATSLCTIHAIRAYLRDGEVPPLLGKTGKNIVPMGWKQCEPDERPWQLAVKGKAASTQGSRDFRLFNSWKAIQKILDGVSL